MFLQLSKPPREALRAPWWAMSHWIGAEKGPGQIKGGKMPYVRKVRASYIVSRLKQSH